MSNLKNLLSRIKGEVKSLPNEVNPTLSGGDDQPKIEIDGFEITDDSDNYYAVSDSTGAIEDFAGTADQIVEFFKGVYDAYVEDYIEAKSNEYYDKGYDLTVATDDGSEDDDDDEEQSEEDDNN
jgi:hypothetical protein